MANIGSFKKVGSELQGEIVTLSVHLLELALKVVPITVMVQVPSSTTSAKGQNCLVRSTA